MILMDNKRNLVSGNTVLAPQYLPKTDDRYEELDKLRKENLRKKRLKNIKSKKVVLRNIAATFVLGLILISRYSMLYDIQKDLNKVSSEISTIKVQNENLKVDLLKFNNINFIEEKAINNLHMVRPDKSQAIYTDLTKDNFSKLTKDKVDSSQQSLLEKFKNIMF